MLSLFIKTYDRLLAHFRISNANMYQFSPNPHIKLRSADAENTACKYMVYREAVGDSPISSDYNKTISRYLLRNRNRYLNNYDISHWNAVKRIFKYLKET